jgi:regulation of enolase protein 1 (concanavalin A-like superfamily)
VPNGNADYRPCDGQSGEFTLSSTGPSFGGTDKIQFVHQPLCGDGEITAKITDITNSGWAGIMFRESLAAGAKKVTLKTQLSTFIRREIRQFTNGFTQTKQIFKPNTTWLRIERSGLVFRGFSSVDGQNWSLVFYTFLQMNQCVEVGIFAEGINQAVLADATFDQVNISNNGGNLAQLPNHIQALNSTDTTDVAISLYPNPSSEKIHLDFRQIPELPMNFVIRDNTGQQVYQQQSLLNENNIAFDLDQLPSGIYYIEVYSKTKNYAVLPFIKQ